MTTNCCEKCIDGSIEIPSLRASCKFPSCLCHKSAEKPFYQCDCGGGTPRHAPWCRSFIPPTDTAEKECTCYAMLIDRDKHPHFWECPQFKWPEWQFDKPTTDTSKKDFSQICFCRKFKQKGSCKHRPSTTDTSDWRERFAKAFPPPPLGAGQRNYENIKAFIEKELERTVEECSKLAVQQEQRYYDAGKSEAFSLVREAITDYKNTDMILTMEEYLLNRLSTLEGK